MKLNNKTGPFILTLLGLLFLFTNGCKKDKTQPVVETGTVTDIDKNVYKTVKIGSQWWMAEDLKVKRYRNGTYIPVMPPDSVPSAWANRSTGICCARNSNSTPGLLYNWYAVTDTGNIAPAGWHVPTDNEWKQLEMYLGMSQADAENVNWRGTNEGIKLKVDAKNKNNNWSGPSDPNDKNIIWGSNESGFTAIAGSCRLYSGGWPNSELSNAAGFWWSVTENNGEAWYRYLDHNKNNVFRYFGPKTYGFSVRCVKD